MGRERRYLRSGLYGFREEDFLSITHYKSMGANEPRVRPVWTIVAWMAGFMKLTT